MWKTGSQNIIEGSNALFWRVVTVINVLMLLWALYRTNCNKVIQMQTDYLWKVGVTKFDLFCSTKLQNPASKMQSLHFNRQSAQVWNALGKCRTLRGKHEQAINCRNELLPVVKCQVTAHRLWHILKQLKFVLSAKENCMSHLQKIACHRVVPYNGDNCPT